MGVRRELVKNERGVGGEGEWRGEWVGRERGVGGDDKNLH